MHDTSHRLHRARRPRGFTLIETMVAMVIMLLALLAMLAVVPFSSNNVQTNSLQVQAVSVGQQFLDDERNAKLHGVPMPSATTVPVDPGQSFVGRSGPNTGYGNFTVVPDGCATQVQTGISGVNTFLCSVQVSWTVGSTTKPTTRTVTVQTLVTN